MTPISQLQTFLQTTDFQTLLQEIYIDSSLLDYQQKRYSRALSVYTEKFGASQESEVAVFSAPGRSEIGGNHTDHQHGKVLAASINLDAIAVVGLLDAPEVRVISGDSDLICISLEHLSKEKDDEGTTDGLIKGVLASFRERGYRLGGFQAYVTSDVLIGAGLSSSAAFESLIGTIVSSLFNEGSVSPIEIAQIGQYAENVYFGKPCGLMDQMACSVGSLVYIDFEDPANPVLQTIEFDLSDVSFSLCIVDTKGSHADLTPDYAAIPAEMKQIASYFGKEVLREVSPEEIVANMQDLRNLAGDRAVLRALHFTEENRRVEEEVNALKNHDFEAFLNTVKESGHSSFCFLQNVYTPQNLTAQNVSLALAVSEILLNKKNAGVCRVHGGGFAGTIQAFVRNDAVEEYRTTLESVFGQDSCHILKIRKYGGRQVL